MVAHREASERALKGKDSIGAHRKVRRRDPLAMVQHVQGIQRRAFGPRRIQMLMAIFAVLVVLWLLGFTVFHVASGLIHLLLILAVISLVMHFARGRRVA
jgi:hypothetical protein